MPTNDRTVKDNMGELKVPADAPYGARVIGCDEGAAIAKRAYTEGRPVLDVAEEMTDLGRAELEALMDPAALTTNKS